MEENTSSALADYWLSITEFYKKDFYSDYITNPKKRIQTGLADNLGVKYWKDYSNAYEELKDSGKLILRAKLITNNNVKIYQVYESKKDRDYFKSQISKKFFHDNVDLQPSEIEYSITENDLLNLIQKIFRSDKKIIQTLKESHRLPGMVIGDPLKDNTLIYV